MWLGLLRWVPLTIVFAAFSAALFLTSCSVIVKLTSANIIMQAAPDLPRVTIKSDGSLDPANAPIQRLGSVYFLTENIINHTLEVQRDNVVIDGRGFTIKHEVKGLLSVYAPERHMGILIADRFNVTIRNITLVGCASGIFITNSSKITIAESVFQGNEFAIMLTTSAFCTITKNNITIGRTGVWISMGCYNTIAENNLSRNSMEAITLSGKGNRIVKNIIDSNAWGIHLYDATENIVVGNVISNNGVNGCGYGVSCNGFNNSIYHNNYINNTNPPSALRERKNFWDNGQQGNYWSHYKDIYPNATEIDNTGVWNIPYTIFGENVDRYPLVNPVNISAVEIPPLKVSEYITALVGKVVKVLSYPLLAMPEEYINYTIARVNGSLWAKVDAAFQIAKIFGAGDIFEIDGVVHVIVSETLLLTYPTPPSTINISIELNGLWLSWGNHTRTYPEATHKTVLGEWPMIHCLIEETSSFFALKIHYEHPIQSMNGKHAFLYDLNIEPYLSPWCNKSKAYFNIRMETSHGELGIYKVGLNGTWFPLDYTVEKEGEVEIFKIEITSEYGKPPPGDLLVIFSEPSTEPPGPPPPEPILSTKYALAAIAAVSTATAGGYVYLKRRKAFA